MAEVDARKQKELEQKFFAERPDIKAGSGSDVLTQEKFNQMNLIEKSQLLESDPETYKKFTGQ